MKTLSLFSSICYTYDKVVNITSKRGLCFYKKRVRVSTDAFREILSYIFGVLAALVMAFFIIYSFGMKTSVIGLSMENTLYNGQTILINRLAYLLLQPKAGDVIVFLPNGNQNTHYYIKRVVATPGDKVQFIDGRLYVNGVAEDKEEYDKVAEPGIAENEIILGDDEYFVLGDNRNNSEDSRSGNIGPVNKKLIEGKAWFHFGYEDQMFGFIQ